MPTDIEATDAAPPLRVVAAAGMESVAEGRLTGLSALDWALTAWKHKDLVAALTRRDLDLRFRGSALGFLWIVVVPVVLAAVYTYASSAVFGARFEGSGPAASALSIYLGTIVFQVFCEPIVKAAGVIHDQSVFVKKVAIPLRILPLVPICSAFATGLVSFAMFGAALLLLGGRPGPVAFLALPILAVLALAVAGLSWLTAALSAYVRDLRQLVGFAATALLFVTPVFYPADHVPERLRIVMDLNPVAYAITALRRTLIEGAAPEALPAALFAAGSLATCVFGYAAYRRLQGGFADVV